MRSRSRLSGPIQASAVFDYYNWGKLVEADREGGHTAAIQCVIENIDDYDNGSSRPESYVDHWKVSFADDSVGRTIYCGDANTSARNYRITSNGAFWAAYTKEYLSSPVIHGDADLSQLYTALVKDARGGMDTGMLSLATIGEVGSLKGLAEGITGMAKAASEFFSSKTTLARAKALAGGDLAYRFSIKTMLMDIRAAFAVGTALENHLKKLLRRNQMTTIPLNTAVQSSCGGDWEGTTYTTLHGDYNGTYDVTDATASLALIEYFGLDQIISTAWELVPFSFVIDYFVNIGDVLGEIEDTLKNSAYTSSSVSLTNLRLTQKSNATADYWCSKNCVGSFPYPGEAVRLSSKRYTRTPLSTIDDGILSSLSAQSLNVNSIKTIGQLGLVIFA